jgi:hypothetical protein
MSTHAPEGNMPLWARIAIVIGGYAAILVLGHFGGRWLDHSFGMDLKAPGMTGARLVLVTGLAIYIALMALPFVPGIELSLALFAVFGSKAAIPIYLATVVALTMSFLAGRLVPFGSLAGLFNFVGLARARELVLRLAPMTPRQRVEALVEGAPSRLVPILLLYKELAVIAALNIPGNALVGGGGGIGMLAGMSGLFTLPRYLAALSVAALPVPLIMLVAGYWLHFIE